MLCHLLEGIDQPGQRPLGVGPDQKFETDGQALTLPRADDDPMRRENWSYVSLVEELRRIFSQPKTDAPELFRRMVFNALISSIDDHPRNHAVVAIDTDWKLSPAYDLTPLTPISADHGDLALECGDMGRFANAESLLTQCERFYLAPDYVRIATLSC